MSTQISELFKTAVELGDIFEIYSDFPKNLLTDISSEKIAELWHPHLPLRITFDRLFDVQPLNPFIGENFPGLKALHINCNNYICGPNDVVWDFENFPSSIEYLFINTCQSGITLDKLQNTSLKWLLIDSFFDNMSLGTPMPLDFKIPDTLDLFVYTVNKECDSCSVLDNDPSFERHFIPILGGAMVANTGDGKYFDHRKNSSNSNINNIVLHIHKTIHNWPIHKPSRERPNMYMYLRKIHRNLIYVEKYI